MDFQEFKQRQRALGDLGRVSYFSDDGRFVVKIKGETPYILEVRAPSRAVLEAELRRRGIEPDGLEIIQDRGLCVQRCPGPTHSL